MAQVEQAPGERDPFGPIEVVVTAVLAMLAGFLVLTVCIDVIEVATGGEPSMSFATVGDGASCIDAGQGSVSGYVASGDGFKRSEGIVNFRDSRGTFSSNGWHICLTDASALQASAAALPSVFDVAFFAGALLLIRWVIRGARAEGMFTDETARRTRRLGWFLILTAVLGGIVVAFARSYVLSAVIRHYDWWMTPNNLDISLIVVIVGLGILTFARILRLAVPLQEEVDATV